MLIWFKDSTLNAESFDMSIFDDVRNIPKFQEMLQGNLLNSPARFGKTGSSGQLLRLAFSDKEHLSLETVEEISVEALSAALAVPETQKIKSISLCIETILNPPSTSWM